MIATTRTGMIYAEYIVEYQRILRINWNSVQDPKSPQKSWQAGFWLAWHSSLHIGERRLILEEPSYWDLHKITHNFFLHEICFFTQKKCVWHSFIKFFYHNSLEASFILTWVWHSSAPACFRILLPSSVLVPAMLDWVNFNITCLPTPPTLKHENGHFYNSWLIWIRSKKSWVLTG